MPVHFTQLPLYPVALYSSLEMPFRDTYQKLHTGQFSLGQLQIHYPQRKTGDRLVPTAEKSVYQFLTAKLAGFVKSKCSRRESVVIL